MMSLWPALVNALAVLATVAVVSTGGTRWAPSAFLVPLVIILWRQRRTVLRVPRGVGGLGRYITARFILIAAAGAQIFAASQFQALEIAAFACAMTALAVEPMVRSANGVAAPYASNFPGPPARNRAAFPYGWIFTLNLVGLLALVLTALAATPLLAVAGAVSIVSIVLALLAFVDIAQRIRARRRFQANLPQLLEEVGRSEEHTSELQSCGHLVCRLLLETQNTVDAQTNSC